MYPKVQNVALGVEEFGFKPGLKGKRPVDLVDFTLLNEIESEGLFGRLYGKPRERGE